VPINSEITAREPSKFESKYEKEIQEITDTLKSLTESLKLKLGGIQDYQPADLPQNNPTIGIIAVEQHASIDNQSPNLVYPSEHPKGLVIHHSNQPESDS